MTINNVHIYIRQNLLFNALRLLLHVSCMYNKHTTLTDHLKPRGNSFGLPSCTLHTSITQEVLHTAMLGQVYLMGFFYSGVQLGGFGECPLGPT